MRAFFQKTSPKLSEQHLNQIGKFVSDYQGTAAVNHLFELASSVDSLVVGEREIFRQFRNAYNTCNEAGLTGDNIRLLQQVAVHTAKEVYANTKIGEKPLSIVSLAMQQFRAHQLSLDSRILMIGAGETNTLVAKFLKKFGYANCTVFNRSIDNAEKVRELIGGEAYHLSDLDQYDGGFDAMFVCTGATEAIITQEVYKKLVKRDTETKVIVDLSVPRNVAEEVVEQYKVHYIDIEQLRLLAEENLNYRKQEIKIARQIIDTKLHDFYTVFQNRQIEKALSAVPHEVKVMKERALHTVYKKQIDDLDGEARELVLEMMDYMEKKFVSIPMRLAKQSV